MNTDVETFEARRFAALQLLQATGIRPANFAPPAVLLAWRLGFRLPPPHFAGFWPTAAVTGSFFAVLSSVLMWLIVGGPDGASMAGLLAASGGAAALFGLAMASYYAHGRRKYRLPPWGSLGAAPAQAAPER